MKYWLVKSEADCYSIDDLKKDKKTAWTGIRNFQARNFMQKDMSVGDLVLYYHSNSEPTGIYGIAKVASKPHPDMTQFEKDGEYFEPRATKDKPVWYCVDLAFVKKFKSPISLADLKKDEELRGMPVIKRGMRLSVQPVLEKHYSRITTHFAS